MSNSEQFCLRWNNHQSTLVSVFENLLDTNVLIDCTLCAEGKFLKAHRVVLSACSPIFKDMMAIQEDKHPIVFLNDVSFLEMRAMLDYMYKGEVNIVQDQLDSFLRTAAALQIKGLTDQGGGGSDEPPAKKGPGRKTGMSDAPESPLVGNAPLREGSMSPTRRRRRVPRRPDSADDQSAENSCDIPSAPQTGSLAPAPSNQSALSSANQSSLSAADLMHHGPVSSTPTSASRLPPVRKHEPIDQTQVVKQFLTWQNPALHSTTLNRTKAVSRKSH
ncbi:unnamed protein product [Nesidiocoris tenuis]|uniref:BTB domain-containing protein n=1 Tax=Nesidiocoris tenuis TaxID=355587 RepID=A0A6H5H8M0_9HEMI|nr:unnamed protein product [Nesidiocoris tenuis]